MKAKDENFPIRLTSGETLATPEALAQYIETQTRRSQCKGRAAEISKYHLEQLKGKL